MEIDRPNAKPLSPEDLVHLETLKSTVEKALEDGTFSSAEIDHIKAIVWADGTVTYEELRTIHETIEIVMGNTPPGLDWLKTVG